MRHNNLETLKASAWDEVSEWLTDHPDADEGDRNMAINELCGDVVPVMTTELFQLVVDDNGIAFLSADSGVMEDEHGDIEPFRALSVCIYEALRDHVQEQLDAQEDDE